MLSTEIIVIIIIFVRFSGPEINQVVALVVVLFGPSMSVKSINDFMLGLMILLLVVLNVLAVVVFLDFVLTIYFLVLRFLLVPLLINFVKFIQIFCMDMLAGDMVISHDIFGHFMLIQVFKAMVFVFFRHLFLIILLFILLLIFGLLSKSRFFALILQLNKLGQKFLSVRVNLLLDLFNCKIVLEINFTLLLLELAKVFAL